MKRSRLLNTKLVENINVPKLPDVIMLDAHEDMSKIFFEEGDLLDAKSIADRLATVVNMSETVGKTLWDMKNTYDTKMREIEETVKDAAEIAEDMQDYIDSQISDVKRNITGLDDELEGMNKTLIDVDVHINNIEGSIIDINSNLNNYATIASLNLYIQELTETDEELREEIEELKNSSAGPGEDIILTDYVKIEDYNKAIGDINLRIDGANDRIISIEEQISTFPSTYATQEWVADKISELGVIQPSEGISYKLVCTPNSIVENTSDGKGSHDIYVKVYKKENGGLTEVSSLPNNYYIYVAEGTNSFNENNKVTDGKYSFNSNSGASVVKFILSNDTTNWSFLDYVDITVAYVENGNSTATVEKNPIIYPAGKWDPEKNYIMSENEAGIATTPYVLHEECYWVLIASESKLAEPVEDSTVWEKFDMYEAVYSDIGVFKQALVGQAVFYKDYIYSQDGILSKKVKDVAEDNSIEINQYSEESNMYELFDPNNPNATDIQYIEEDFIFSTELGEPTNPNEDLTGWYETIAEDPTWVAYRKRLYGASTWSEWVVKSFAEWDEPVGGILSSDSQLPSSGSEDYSYIIGENLYMWNGTAWINVGNFKIALVDSNLSKNSKFAPNTYINLKTGEIYSRKSKFDDAELDNAVCTRLSVIDGFLLHHQEYGYDEYASAIGSSSSYKAFPNLDQISNKLLVINSRSINIEEDWLYRSIPYALLMRLPMPTKDNRGALRYLHQTKYIGNKVCIVNNTHLFMKNKILETGLINDFAEVYTGMDPVVVTGVLYEEFISSDPNALPPYYDDAVILMPGLCLMAELKMKYIPNEKSIISDELHTYGLTRHTVGGLYYYAYESDANLITSRGLATPYFYWAFTIFDLSDRSTLNYETGQMYLSALNFSDDVINYG